MKRFRHNELMHIIEIGAERLYNLARAEMLERLTRVPDIKATGEFVRTRSVQKRHVALEDSDKPGTRKKEKKKSRRFSAATRKKMAESQRKRWAKAAKKKKK